MPELRDYQQEAIDNIVADWNKGTLNTLMAHATGLGKTVTGINLLKQQMKSGERAIWAAHRDELIQQPLSRFAEWWPESQLFSGIVKAKQNDVSARLIFASVQTMSRPARLKQLVDSGSIDYLVIDECLPYSAEVLLADGDTRPIGQIVNALDRPEVVCYNKGVLTTRPVTNTWRLKPQAPLVRVIHEQGKIICTGNHRLLTLKGWMSAGLLEENIDHVLALREGIQKRERAGNASSLLREAALPILREGPENQSASGKPYQKGAHRLPVQALQPHSVHSGRYEQAHVGRASRMDAGTFVDEGHTRVSAETLGSQARQEESNVWNKSHGNAEPGLVDGREARDSAPASPGPVARPRIHTSPDEWQETAPNWAGDSLLGNATPESTRHDPLHRGLQLHAQGKETFKEPRLHSAWPEEGHRAIRRFLPQPRRSASPDTVLWEPGMGSADYLGRGGKKKTGDCGALDYGVPRPSLVLSVEVLPEQEQWVYDLTVEEVHNFIADGVVASNCHHSAADSYQRAIRALREANPDLRHVGMSATPWRSDGVGMIVAYDHIADQKGILWGVEHGWLVPPRGQQVQTDVSLAGIKLVAGDFAKGQLQEVLSAAGWHHLVARAYIEHGEGRQALAYTPGVQTSKELCDALLERDIKAAHIDGKTPLVERRAIIKSFRERKIQVLCNCMIFTEGFDAPSTECILMARPTKSHGLLTQIVGRGLRPFLGKEDCLVLLFTTTGAHILTLFDLGKSKRLKKAQEKAELLGVDGFSGAIELFDRERLDGAGLYANAVSLFAQSAGAWFRDGAVFSLGLGKDKNDVERTLVILPPNNGDGWRLIGLGRKPRGGWQDYEIMEHSEIDPVMLIANEVAERRGASILYEKDKGWRRQPASRKQLAVLRKFGGIPLGLSKGDAARLLTHKFAMATLKRKGYDLS